MYRSLSIYIRPASFYSTVPLPPLSADRRPDFRDCPTRGPFTDACSQRLSRQLRPWTSGDGSG